MLDSGVLMTTDKARFRDWFREQLKARGFYTPATDTYAVAAFSRFLTEQGEPIDAVQLARYLKDDNTLPSTERCRSLARGLGIKPAVVLSAAGYIQEGDF